MPAATVIAVPMKFVPILAPSRLLMVKSSIVRFAPLLTVNTSPSPTGVGTPLGVKNSSLVSPMPAPVTCIEADTGMSTSLLISHAPVGSMISTPWDREAVAVANALSPSVSAVLPSAPRVVSPSQVIP